MTSNPLFVPPAAEGLPLAALDSATEGADRLDARALTPYGRNFLAHALVQLARDGWLRPEPGEGFEPVRDRETPEPETAPPARAAAALRDRIAEALKGVRVWRTIDGCEGWEYAGTEALAAAVLAVFPEPPSRAAVLREAADAAEGIAIRLYHESYMERGNGAYDVMDALRKAARVADEEQPAEAQQQPETEAPTACNSGPGWYEVINPRNATTCIALVYDDGTLYLPEGDALTADEFAFATARGQAHRLVRADDQEPRP